MVVVKGSYSARYRELRKLEGPFASKARTKVPGRNA